MVEAGFGIDYGLTKWWKPVLALVMVLQNGGSQFWHWLWSDKMVEAGFGIEYGLIKWWKLVLACVSRVRCT